MRLKVYEIYESGLGRAAADLEWTGVSRKVVVLRGYEFEHLDLFIAAGKNMGSCVGSEKLGEIAIRNASTSAYTFSLLLSPVISFWDCIIRRMRYSFKPEWV
ncbi:unnamed protein product [Spirodela intermedia]|uniref:Uncharacterized protein n=1 Tax=Spirodela intermedia TaxID=51605 RepID=A0A7I8JB52_SPIIN|nr:unnamed protein product [Spirodela intermedia]CAA6666945.1 unnamed protein product [Spirodela intermedia]